MSDSEFLKMAEAEVQRLQAELAETPLYQRFIAARGVVEVYRRDEQRALYQGQHAANFGRPDFNKPQKTAAAIFTRFAEKTKAAQIEAVAVGFFKETRQRATSGQLLEAMVNAGIEIGGKEPNKALSAYLSSANALNNVRELGGYGLAEWGNAAGPDLLTKTGA